MPMATPAPMASDTRHAPAPAPPVNRKYEAIGNTLRWIQDGKKAVEIFTDDSGVTWALPGPVLVALVARAELAVAERSAAAG